MYEYELIGNKFDFFLQSCLYFLSDWIIFYISLSLIWINVALICQKCIYRFTILYLGSVHTTWFMKSTKNAQLICDLVQQVIVDILETTTPIPFKLGSMCFITLLTITLIPFLKKKEKNKFQYLFCKYFPLVRKP